MKIYRISCILLLLVGFVAGCTKISEIGHKPYDVPAYRPTNPKNVVVKVSLDKQAVYVLEGTRPLLVTAICAGTTVKPTPKGRFTVYNKIRNKRSGSYGFAVAGDQIRPAKASDVRGARYVGYPMPFWVEFAPGYGFHQGSVHPIPRTHGCIRLHANVAPKFFEIVRVGTPVLIANKQPEDETLGKNVHRPKDFNDPDPPSAFMISPSYFEQLAKPHFEN